MKLKYFCQYCNRELTRYNSLIKHEKICKLNPENNNNKTVYKCNFCTNIYTHKYAFNRHLKTHQEYNPKKYIWKCKYCTIDTEFNSRRSLEKHVKTCHPNIKRIINCQKHTYICQFCNNEIYTTISGFKNHEKMCIKNPNRKLPDISKYKTPEFRLQASERMKERHKLGLAATFQNRNKCPHSFPEQWLIGILKNEFNQIENIDYKTEKPFYRYFLDFAWPEKRLCIEIDGELHRYKKQKENDTKKDELLKQDGWKELRLKWAYIIKNKKETIEFIRIFLSECGDITIPLYKSKKELHEEKQKEKLVKYPHNKLSDIQLLKRKNKILNSGIDLTKFGWVNKVSKLTNLSRREINFTVNYFEDLKNKVFYRKINKS